MNARCQNASLSILKLVNRKYRFCVTPSTFENHRQNIGTSVIKSAKAEPTRNLKQKENGRRIIEKKTDSDVKLKSYLSSDKHDPDCFGTLSDDWKTHQQLLKISEEDDDIVVNEFASDKEYKTRLTINQYGRIIKQFLEQKKISQAIDVLETRMLKRDRVKPENYIYNLLIGACGKVGYTKKAFTLHKQMRERGLKVTGHTYTGLFNACANSPYPQDALIRAQHLRATLVEKAFLMNQTLYHAMIKAFGRCGDMETAFLLVDEMVEKRIMVSDETFNFLLQACITDKSAGFRHALLVWRKMLEKRVRPSLFSFNLLLRCSRDCGMGDDTSAELVVQVLLQAGKRSTNKPRLAASTEQPECQIARISDSSHNVPNLISTQPTMGDVMTMKSITSAEHRLMLMGGSAGVLDLMKTFNVKPDIKTFTQLLDQIPSTLPDEIDLLDRIKQAKVPLDCDFCNMLIRKRALRSDYENAKPHPLPPPQPPQKHQSLTEPRHSPSSNPYPSNNPCTRTSLCPSPCPSPGFCLRPLHLPQHQPKPQAQPVPPPSAPASGQPLPTARALHQPWPQPPVSAPTPATTFTPATTSTEATTPAPAPASAQAPAPEPASASDLSTIPRPGP